MEKHVDIEDHVALGINAALSMFEEDESSVETTLPSSLTNHERAYVHRMSSSYGVISKSVGQGTSRYVVLHKVQERNIVDTPLLCKLSQTSKWVLQSLLARWPSKPKEKIESLRPEKNCGVKFGYYADITKPSGRLPNGIPQIPSPCLTQTFDSFQSNLPIYSKKSEILETIWKNDTVLIAGKPGCGKSTQLPQYILDESLKQKQVCRIICVQPRRSLAVSMAERVAKERGECVGQTVGYQIRLESRASPRTLLTFCTNEVLLRTLMAGQSVLQTMTHIIMDEIQERDKFGDILLIRLRQLIPNHTFHLLLNTCDTDNMMLINYLQPCPVIKVDSKSFDVKEYFLEDIISRSSEFGIQHDVIRVSEEVVERENQNMVHDMEDVLILDKSNSVEDLLENTSDENSLQGGINQPTKTYDGSNGVVSVGQIHDDLHHVDYDLILCLLELLCTDYTGSILVFLPGYDEIITLRDRIIHSNKVNRTCNLNIFILYSSTYTLSDHSQIYKPEEEGTRKIILSTNVAESCITVDDVCHVIDLGRNNVTNTMYQESSRKIEWISQVSSKKRCYRAGKQGSGVCFHLFSKARKLGPLIPELTRIQLYELILQIKLLDTSDPVKHFLTHSIDPPNVETIDNAVQLLKQIDALDETSNITELGQHLVDLPIDPRLGKMILYAVVLKCLDPILTIACALTFNDSFIEASPCIAREVINTRCKFAAGTYSDHMCLLRAFQAWQKARCDGWEKRFCDKYFMSLATMEKIIGLRSQLLGQLRATGFVRARGGSDIRDLNLNSENWAVVKAAVCVGMHPNIAQVDRCKKIIRISQNEKLQFHPSSVLTKDSCGKELGNNHAIDNLPSDWIMFNEKINGDDGMIATCCTCVTSVCVALFTGTSSLTEAEYVSGPTSGIYDDDCSSDNESDEINKLAIFASSACIRLIMDPVFAGMLAQIRTRWNSLFARRIRNPSKPWQPDDEAMLSAVINILTSEEDTLKLMQPSGIGQRPRPAAQDDVDRTRCFVNKSS
nr:3'-5' RNA helicase YTHDC2-like [Ciona intestinalis]|eukprot:XP_002123879.3 3'-5' RNA helicase YTHDC2-like [Ciona intestinalis]